MSAMHIFTIFILCCLMKLSVSAQWTYSQSTGFHYHIKATTRRNLNFSQAEEYCIDIGGHLASVHSEEENQFITELTAKVIPRKEGHSSLWIGLHQKNGSDNFVWTDGTPFNYDKWGKGEPNNWKGIEDCVFMVVASSNSTPSSWLDLRCDMEFAYSICKKEDSLFKDTITTVSTVSRATNDVLLPTGDDIPQSTSVGSIFAVVLLIILVFGCIYFTTRFFLYGEKPFFLSRTRNIHSYKAPFYSFANPIGVEIEPTPLIQASHSEDSSWAL